MMTIRHGARFRVRTVPWIASALVFCAGMIESHSQTWSGTVDETFDPGSAANDAILALAVQPDDRIILAGRFTAIDGVSRSRIARLLPDGGVDPEFDPGTGPNGQVTAMTLQPDGRILILGSFTSVAGTNRNQLARLNGDGSLDATFDPSGGPAGVLHALKLEPDGRILVGGDFEVFQGLSRNKLVRLRSDGMIESGFEAPFISSGIVHALGLSLEGDIYAGGLIYLSLTENGGPPLAKLNLDGLVDGAFFRLGIQAYNWEKIRFIESLADGTLLIGGEFSTVGNAYPWDLAYFDPDGKPLLQRNASLPIDGTVECFADIGDGWILVGGEFIVSNLLPRKNLALVGPQGVDEAFAHAGVGTDGPVIAMARQSSGKVVIAGNFLNVDGMAFPGLARLQANPSPPHLPVITVEPVSQTLLEGQALELGVEVTSHETPGFQWFHDGNSIDSATNRSYSSRIATINHGGLYRVEIRNGAGVAASLTVNVSILPVPVGEGSMDVTFNANLKSQYTRQLLAMDNGQVLAAGSFQTLDSRRRALAKFGPDGSIDPSFASGYGPTSPYDPDGSTGIDGFIRQDDGLIMVKGNFTSYNFVPRNRLTRLHEDGSLDMSFDPPQFRGCCIRDFAVQTNGQVLVAGPLTYPGETSTRYLSRLNADGSLDTVFQPQFLQSGYSVTAVTVMADGRILVGGGFTNVNGVTKMRLARLEPDGRLDTSFHTSIDFGGSWPVTRITLAEPDRIWITGEFTRVSGIPRKNIVRIFTNGDVDLSFDPGTSTSDRFSSAISEAIPQLDGRVLIDGFFTNFAGITRMGNAKLHPDGKLDTSFDLVPDQPYRVSTIASSRDGKIWVGGHFQSLNGYPRKGLARINSELLVPQLDGPVVSNGMVQVGFPTDHGRIYTLEYQDALRIGPWSSFPAIQGNGTYQTHSEPVPERPRRFYRLRVQ